MHRSRIFQLALIGFLCGIALASWIAFSPLVSWFLVCVAGLCMIIRKPQTLAIGLTLVAATLGVWRTTRVLTAPSSLGRLAQERTNVVVDGFVDGDFTPTRMGGQYSFRVLRIDSGTGPVSIDDRLMIFGQDSLRPRYGQVLSLSGKLQLPKNSSDFDYASYLAKGGIHALIYFPAYSVPTDWEPPLSMRVRTSALSVLHRTRSALVRSLTNSVRQPEAAYLAGLLVGAQGVVPADIKDMFSRTGTSHILAISGYNITVVSSALVALLAFLGRRRAFGMSVVGIIAFTIMVGASASVVRAGVMGIMVLIAQQIGRRGSSGSAILISAAFMCAFNPMLLRWDTGFQLSFLALIGIVYLEPIIAGPLERLVRWRVLGQVIATTIAASVMVMPLILYDFGQLAIYTLPTNMFVLPLVPVAMALGFATAVGGLIMPFAGQFIGQSAWLVATLQLATVRFFADLPYASVSVHISGAVLLTIYTALAAGLILHYRSTHARTNIRHSQT